MTDKEIIIDGVDVTDCPRFVPRYMEDYDIDILNYCGYHYKPCEKVDIKYCIFKQLKRKEQECDKYEQALDAIKSIVSSTLDCGEWIGQGDNKMENILDIINKVKDTTNET